MSLIVWGLGAVFDLDADMSILGARSQCLVLEPSSLKTMYVAHIRLSFATMIKILLKTCSKTISIIFNIVV